MSPLVFILVMEEATRKCRVGGLWALLYADDLALTAETWVGGIDVWGVEAGYGEERAEGKLGKDKDDGDWGEDGECGAGGEVSM